MGGKTATSTQQVSVPSQVLAQYQSVNALANQTAAKPFQQYGGSFVAPINAEQQSGIAQTNQSAQEAQPYYGAAAGTLGSAQAATNPVNAAAEYGTAASAAPLSASTIDSYLSPYLNTVLGSTSSLLNQENQQQQAGQLGDAISSGAFGGDRTGIAAANLGQQQELANANVLSGIANTGYQSALSTGMGEQQIGLAGASQLAGIGSTAYGEGANTANEYGALGTGAENAALTGASAVTGAGTLEQQTQQAQDTAEYNQFLQEQSYPFQVDQFLANIAEGTGALSGSTTTTQQPGGFFSDKRLKHDIKRVGKTFDGQPIYSYKMHGDHRTHIGLIAQNVEKKHPHAVGLAAGFKTVDYGRATEEAANRGHFYGGGVVPFRRRRDAGGYTGPYGDMSSILATQENMYQPNQTRNRNIPNQTQSHQLAVASGSPTPQPSGASKINQSMGLVNNAQRAYKSFAPSSSPSSGVAGNYPALNANYFNAPASGGAPGSATDFSTLGDVAPAASSTTPTASLAAPAAADAAAPAVADAAVPVAADAAGTAVAGGATDAAATELAAALAAEYAAPAVIAAAKRGGRIGLDAGGVPYTGVAAGQPYSAPSGGDLDIPDTENTAKLQTAGALKKQPTGLQTLMSMGQPDTASTIGGQIFSNTALGSRRGGRIDRAAGGLAGRIHKDVGGDLDDDSAPPINGDGTIMKPGDTYQEPDAWTRMKDQAISFFSPTHAAMANGAMRYDPPANRSTPKQQAMDSLLGTDPYANESVTDPNAGGQASVLQELGFPKTPPAPAAPAPQQGPPAPTHRAPRGGVAGPSQAAQIPQGPDVPPAATQAPVTYTGGVSPSAMGPSAADVQAPTSVGVQKPSFGDRVGAILDKVQGSSMAKPENWVPIVKALSAMGTAPTKHLGVALAAGAGAGAGSYMDTRQQAADIQATQAAAGLTQAHTQQAELGTQTSNVGGLDMVNLANGQKMLARVWAGMPANQRPPLMSQDRLGGITPGSPVSAAPPAAPAPPPQAPKWKYLGDNGRNQAETDYTRLIGQPPNQGERADSNKIESEVNANATSAARTGNMLGQLTKEVLAQPDAGPGSSGAFGPLKTAALSRYNDVVRTLGAPQFTINDSGLDAQAAAGKLSAALQFAQAHGADQNSLGALEVASHVVPNQTMSKDQQIEVLGGMYIDKQRALDQQRYLQEYKQNLAQAHPGMGDMYLAQNAMAAARTDHKDTQYAAEKEQLLRLMRGQGVTQRSPNLSRYITNE